MRRMLAVATVSLVVLVAIGAWRARADTLDEMKGSLDQARVAQALLAMRDASVDDGLRALEAIPGLRHLQVELRDESGRVVSRVSDEDSDTWLVRQWRAGFGTLWAVPRNDQAVSYPVPLRDGRVWAAHLTATPDSEVVESISNLVGILVLLLAAFSAMLAAMYGSVRRSLQPLQTLVDAIAGVERHELSPVKALPPMPVRELESIAQSLRHLAAAQERSEAGRRVLAHRLLSLQEEERQRIARDLHDEFGQRLTALRVDATWLQRSGSTDGKGERVIAGMVEQLTMIQDDVRRLLASLRPLGTTPTGLEERPETMGRLRSMLAEIVRGWARADGADGPSIELLMDTAGDDEPIPPAVALTVYRMTQEAITNVVRHAAARHCTVAVSARDGADGGRLLHWQVSDDGHGIVDTEAALRRGTGLAGLKDRVWTLAGRFELTRPETGSGTVLQASFRIDGGVAP